MALVGPISGSNSLVAISGSVIIANVVDSAYPTLASDSILFVSGATGGKDQAGVSVFGGDTVVSGALYVSAPGIGQDVTFYGEDSSAIGLQWDADANEHGKLTLGQDDHGVDFQVYGEDSNNYISWIQSSNTLSLYAAQGAINTKGNVVFDVASQGWDFTVNSNNKTAVFVDGDQDQVLILSGGSSASPNEGTASDINFYVSGSVGSAGTGIQGTSLFGGDIVSSGSINSVMGLSGSLTKLIDGTSYLIAGSNVAITSASNGAVTIAAAGDIDGSGAATRLAYWSDTDTLTSDTDLIFDGDTLTTTNSSNTAIPAIKIDRNYTGTTTIGNYITDPQGLLIDYDVTGVIASGQTQVHDALAINYNQDSPTMVGTIEATGADIRMTGGTSGAQSMKGVAIRLTGADTNTGIDITVPNDGTHIVARSPDNILDQFKISVGAAGATTLSTNDNDAGLANLTLDVDGKILLEAVPGSEVVVNNAGANVDFRVASQNESEAILVDAATDVLHINKGKSAFSTKIWSNSDNALEVNSTGVVINEEAHATNDFRVESVNNAHMLFVDSGNDRLGIGSVGASPATTVHVKASDPTLRIQRSSNANDSSIEFAGSAGAIGAVMHLSSSNDLVFKTHDGSSTEEILRLGSHYGTSNRQIILLSGSAMSADSMQPKQSTDINFFVSGSQGSKGTATKGTSVFGGDVVISGSLYGGNINTTGSFNVPGPSELVTTASISIAGGEGFAHRASLNRTDTYFFVSGNMGTNLGAKPALGVAVFGGETVISGNLHLPTGESALFFGTDTTKTYVKSPGLNALDLSGDIVRMGANVSTAGPPGTDVNFFASGSIDSKDTLTKGTAVFGGDVVTSGSLYVGAQSAGAKGLILLSPNGSKFKLVVDNAGNLSTTPL